MRALGLLATLAALTAGLLLALTPLDPRLTYGFYRNTTATPASAPITPADGLPYTRRNVRFDSHGTSLDAWLYTPLAAAGAASAAAIRHPIMIMAHGLGAQKELGLHRFADAFAGAGLAVLVFDYRTFGGSEGEPRHWASPRRHLEDWREALRFVKSGGLGPEYDTETVGLWGTSYAGGHVLVVAAEQPPGSLAAVVSMIPHLDGLEASKASVRRRGLPASLRLIAAGLHDRTRAAVSDVIHRASTWLLQPDSPSPAAAETPAAGSSSSRNISNRSGSSSAGDESAAGGVSRVVEAVRRRLRDAVAPLLPPYGSWSHPLLPPAYVKLVGLEGEMALMELSPDQLRSYFSKHPPVYEGGWRPLVLSRFTLETSSYSPIEWIPRVTTPVLFISALKDKLCPAEVVRRAASLLPPANGSISHTSSTGSAGSSQDSSRSSGVGGAELLELNCTHFDAYLGEHLAAATEAMVRFTTGYLLPQSKQPPQLEPPQLQPPAATVTTAATVDEGVAAAAEAAAAESGLATESEVEATQAAAAGVVGVAVGSAEEAVDKEGVVQQRAPEGRVSEGEGAGAGRGAVADEEPAAAAAAV